MAPQLHFENIHHPEDCERILKMLQAGEIKGNSLIPINAPGSGKTKWINMLHVVSILEH